MDLPELLRVTLDGPELPESVRVALNGPELGRTLPRILRRSTAVPIAAAVACIRAPRTRVGAPYASRD